MGGPGMDGRELSDIRGVEKGNATVYQTDSRAIY
jgi:hypothetical protein